MKKVTFIVGGARSGKSRMAQELAGKYGVPVLFAATATAGDAEMRRRIEQHRKERPANWRTLEATANIGKQIEQDIGDAEAVIIDDITLLISNIFSRYPDEEFERIEEVQLEQEINTEIKALTACMERVEANFIIVSNEVGMGLVPENRMGRLYRDLLGKANQMLAKSADEVYLMVAGLPLKIKPGN